MAIDAHLQSLSERHRTLEDKITTEQKRPLQDDSRLHELKRLKLRIKDQITQLKQQES